MTHNDFISNPLEFWMSLFPSATREKPRFSALAEAILRQAADLAAVEKAIPPAFSILQATGSQLDAAGEACGIQRQESWSDETYRSVLLRKLKLNTWDGTNETVEACLEAGETLTDTGGNNVTVQTTGTLPLPVQELLPVPVGVAVVRY